jgi:hypothetical protein
MGPTYPPPPYTASYLVPGTILTATSCDKLEVLFPIKKPPIPITGLGGLVALLKGRFSLKDKRILREKDNSPNQSLSDIFGMP